MKKFTGKKSFRIASQVRPGDTINWHGKHVHVDVSERPIHFWSLSGPQCAYVSIPFWDHAKGGYQNLSVPANTKLTFWN